MVFVGKTLKASFNVLASIETATNFKFLIIEKEKKQFKFSINLTYL